MITHESDASAGVYVMWIEDAHVAHAVAHAVRSTREHVMESRRAQLDDMH